MFSWVTKGRLTALVALAFLALGWFVAVTVESIVWPRQEVPDQVDAVVVMAGGMGERAVFGLAAVDLGFSDTIVVSVSPVSAELCSEAKLRLDVRVICFDSPGDTSDEAARVAEIAERNGFDNLLLVTSGYHLQRAERWLNRCFDGRVYPLAADARLSGGLVVHEVLATAGQATFWRSCPEMQ